MQNKIITLKTSKKMSLKQIFTTLWKSRTNAYGPHNLAYSASEPIMEKVEQKSDAEPLPEADADGYVNWQVPDTPLYIRGNNEEGYFVTIGKKKLLSGGKDVAEMLEAVKGRDYTLLVNMFVAIIDDYAEVKAAKLRAEQEDAREAVKKSMDGNMKQDPDLFHDKEQ